MVDKSDVDGVLTRSNSVTLENDRNEIQHREDNIYEVYQCHLVICLAITPGVDVIDTVIWERNM